MGALHGTSEPVQWSPQLTASRVKVCSDVGSRIPCKSIHGYISAFEDWQLLIELRTAQTDKAEAAVHGWLSLTCRVLEENMVITVEPGCYFNRFLLEPAFQDPKLAKFLRPERIRQFWVGS